MDTAGILPNGTDCPGTGSILSSRAADSDGAARNLVVPPRVPLRAEHPPGLLAWRAE